MPLHPAEIKKKRLIFRLSSLGDVVLACSALEVAPPQGTTFETDWVVSREFAPLLEGHPRLRKVWSFDRRAGLVSWIRLCHELWREGYDEVLDLHSSLRTAVARWLWRLWNLRGSVYRQRWPRWRVISKSRFRLYGMFLLKSLWPETLRPQGSWTENFAKLAGGTGQERPRLAHLTGPFDFTVPSEPYFCVMPGSAWPGKRWPVERFVEVLQEVQSKMGLLPVILGTQKDLASVELCKHLALKKIPHFSGVGRLSLVENAKVLGASRGYLGNDTGLAHVAEAVGVPALVIFGPTVPEMGFAPWKKQSVSVGSSLGCRPCGKDGRFCYRILDRYACLRSVEAKSVSSSLNSMLKREPEVLS